MTVANSAACTGGNRGILEICFIPEFSPTVPGLVTRPLVDPEVAREVSLVSIAGRRFSPAVGTFVKAIKAYKWPVA